MTTIEFLVKEINKLTGLTIEMDEPCVEQAREMEKEQILGAHIKGHNAPSSTIKNWDAEQYYNETFKQQEQ
jgi:hypothetical protein